MRPKFILNSVVTVDLPYLAYRCSAGRLAVLPVSSLFCLAAFSVRLFCWASDCQMSGLPCAHLLVPPSQQKSLHLSSASSCFNGRTIYIVYEISCLRFYFHLIFSAKHKTIKCAHFHLHHSKVCYDGHILILLTTNPSLSLILKSSSPGMRQSVGQCFSLLLLCLPWRLRFSGL
jgi:hypothetical protein